jgi:tetratricopeptide (TPR) repeat protein
LKGDNIRDEATATKCIDLVKNSEDLADAVLHKANSQTKSLFIKAFAASRLGRYEEAEAYYRQVIKKRPQESAAYLFLGLLYQEMEEREKALQMWREVVSIDKDSDLAEVARYHITRALRSA